MTDVWATDRDPFASWSATVTLDRSRPEPILDWVAALVEAGEREEVYQVRSTPSGYRRASGTALAAFLRDQFAERGVVDAFGFDDYSKAPDGSLEIASKVAFHLGDRSVEEYATDLGKIVEETRPETRATGTVAHVRPLHVSGFAIHWTDPTATMYVGHIPWMSLRFHLHSDIWLPWIWGHFVPFEDRARELYDNIDLALHHTPRLNRFLQEARAQTLAVGGSWRLESSDQRRSYLRPQMNDDGVLLDCPRPARG
jgi:hypothetical protein